MSVLACAQAGEAVMGVRPEPGAVEAGTAALAARARERATRVRLVWRYAGRSVEAAGPLLGGWGRRVPLAPCARGSWAAEVWVRAPSGATVAWPVCMGMGLPSSAYVAHAPVAPSLHGPRTAGTARKANMGRCVRCVQGLRPGLHEYKYIVDGVWTTDSAQPAECAHPAHRTTRVPQAILVLKQRALPACAAL